MTPKTLNTTEELQSITRQIVKGYDPDKIILFGSFAEGKPHRWSDYDIFVIKNTKEPFYDRLTNASRTLREYPSRGVDILVYTPQELKEPNYFVETVLNKGKVLYEKPSLQQGDSKLAQKSSR